MDEDQFGFKTNRGKREAILCGQIIDGSFKVNRKIYVAFVDIPEAFDNDR